MRLVFVLSILIGLTLSVQADSLNLSFESNIDPFSRFGVANVELSKSVMFHGQSSLKVADRRSTWDGCQIDLTQFFQQFKKIDHEISMYIFHRSKAPELFRIIAVLQTDKASQHIILTEKVVMPNTWKKISARFTLADRSFENVSLLILSPSNHEHDYYVDLLSVVPTEKVLHPGTVLYSSFDGSLDDWQPRGAEVNLAIDGTIVKSGSGSLKVQGRTKNWHGAQIDVKNVLQPGKSYEFTVWVYQNSGEDQRITLTMQRKYAGDEETNYDTIVWQRLVPTGKWTEIRGTYSVRLNAIVEELTFYVESPNPTLEYNIDEVMIVDRSVMLVEPEWEIPSLKEVFKDHFRMGVALPYKVLMNPMERKLVVKHFNSITAENEMKPESLLVSIGKYSFLRADEYIRFAEENGMVVRGHTLVWHSQTPEWFFRDETGKFLSKEAMIERMRQYIHDVVGHFKGKIYAWDVVNEAIDPSQPDGYRRSLWYQIIGPEYIELAFRFAHEADPNALLFYNDYNTFEPRKREFIYKLVKGLKEKGVPIHGIGMQQHVCIFDSIAEIDRTIQLFKSIPGIKIHVTELDVSVYRDQTSNYPSLSYELAIEQAHFYRRLFDVYKKHSDAIENVTFWGLKDDYSWKSQRRNDWPLLFDRNYQAKYAYWAIVDPHVLPTPQK
ncbi:endo-1,4-beta-xylanase [Pseudothermotoga sp.]|uniref:endo-1,4-beta-xylanase n=1 Tax=Pseudothermotoga sp. TaxID=2033661 RepID=UPI0031F61EE0